MGGLTAIDKMIVFSRCYKPHFSVLKKATHPIFGCNAFLRSGYKLF